MLTPITIQKIELSIAYTAVYLASEDRTFVIYLSTHSGKLLQQLIAKSPVERPLSFDVILSLITAANLTPIQVLIDNEKEGVFFTKIFLEKKESDHLEMIEIDARPSESLAIAIKFKIPLFITTEVLNNLKKLSQVS